MIMAIRILLVISMMSLIIALFCGGCYLFLKYVSLDVLICIASLICIYLGGYISNYIAKHLDKL